GGGGRFPRPIRIGRLSFPLRRGRPAFGIAWRRRGARLVGGAFRLRRKRVGDVAPRVGRVQGRRRRFRLFEEVGGPHDGVHGQLIRGRAARRGNGGVVRRGGGCRRRHLPTRLRSVPLAPTFDRGRWSDRL